MFGTRHFTRFGIAALAAMSLWACGPAEEGELEDGQSAAIVQGGVATPRVATTSNTAPSLPNSGWNADSQDPIPIHPDPTLDVNDTQNVSPNVVHHQVVLLTR